MKKKDIFIQDSMSSCGAECIRSVVSFYGGYVPLEMVLEDTFTDKSGTNAYEIVETLKKYGFDAYGMNISLDNLDKSRLPAIAHVKKDGYDHFVVIYDIVGNKIITMDPECGRKEYTKETFDIIYDDRAIFLTPSGEILKIEKNNSLLKLLIPFIKKNIGIIIIFTILSLIVIAFSLLASFHIKLLSIAEKPIFITLALVVLKVFVAILIFIKTSLQVRIVKYVDINSFQTVISHIFKLPIRYLKNRRVGEIVKKIEDLSKVKDLYLKVFLTSFIDIVLLSLSLFFMIYISLDMTLIYLFVIILYSFLTLLFKKVIYKLSRDNTEKYEDYTGTLVEYLNGIESIKNLNEEDKFLDDLHISLKNYVHSNAETYKKETMINLVKSNTLEIGSLVVTLVGFMSIGENFNLMDLLTFDSLFSLLYSSCENLIQIVTESFKSKIVHRNICEFLDVKEERTERHLDQEFKCIETYGLSYSYDHVHDTIKNLDFNLKKGDKILLSGPSGVGKSTLVKCLSGRLEDYMGKILINGKDIKSVSVSSLRKHILYIGQEEHLYRGTILDNITLGRVDIDRFKYVCQIACVDEILDKRNDRENTMLLEGASNISGGEKSRIILARALYKNPSVLIIDETLSSVSEAMEDSIIAKLKTIEDLSILYITHRNKKSIFKDIVQF